MDREVRRLRDQFSVKFAENCYNGFWFSPEMDFIMDTVKLAQKHVTGEVQLRLYKGSASVRSRDAPLSLYDKELVSMDVGGGYDPRDAEGFIKINSIVRLDSTRAAPSPPRLPLLPPTHSATLRRVRSV